MGGMTYNRSVGSSSVLGASTRGSGMTSSGSSRVMSSRGMHKSMDPKDRIIISEAKYPIALGIDVTGSNIDFAKLCWDKAPMLHGQIEQQGYLKEKEFEMAFAGIGDAFCDRAPLQISDFAYGIECDSWIEKIYLESGGGGQRTETYELFAYYMVQCVDMPNAELPFCFIVADEEPYPSVDKSHIKDIIGKGVQTDIPSEDIFSALIDKFRGNAYCLLTEYCGMGYMYDEWSRYMPKQHILKLKDEKGVVDTILGTIAIASKSRTLDEYEKDMENRGQTTKRISSVSKSLTVIEESKALAVSTTGKLPAKSKKAKKKMSKRI